MYSGDCPMEESVESDLPHGPLAQSLNSTCSLTEQHLFAHSLNIPVSLGYSMNSTCSFIEQRLSVHSRNTLHSVYLFG